MVDRFHNDIPGMLSKYELRNVFNVDETALFYRQLPEHTLEKQRKSVSGSKKSKDRVTLLVGGSIRGEKLPLLMMGKFKNPRCFNQAASSLPLRYCSSKNAWMTKTLFGDWLSYINGVMMNQNRTILLFVDNAAVHRVFNDYSHIRLAFLPPNCTAAIQPMDQGTIRSLKSKYRKAFLEHVAPESEEDVNMDFLYRYNLLTAMQLIKTAWSDVHPDTIVNSFLKAGFYEGPTTSREHEEVDANNNFEVFIDIDEKLLLTEVENANHEVMEVSTVQSIYNLTISELGCGDI